MQCPFAVKVGFCPVELPTIAHANPEKGKPQTLGTVVGYSCMEGYEATNSTAATCIASENDDGKWEEKGTCKRIYLSLYIVFVKMAILLASLSPHYIFNDE